MKSKILGQSDVVSLALVAGAFVLTAGLYQRLPSQLPTHFDLHGAPNGWMPRDVGAWLVPGVALVSWAVVRLGALLLPSPWRARLQASPAGMAMALVVALLFALHCVTLHAAIAKPTSVGGALGLILGAFWIALGLLLPRIRRNPWIGVRTPWTLSSDENWARTHRVGGMTFVGGGALAILGTATWGGTVAVPFLVLSAVVPAVYSFLLARRLPPET